MEYFLIWYCLFAVTTSLASLYELVMPVLNKRQAERGKLEHSKVIYYIVFLCCNILAAPLVFFSCIIPEWSLKFQEALYVGLFEEQEV